MMLETSAYVENLQPHSQQQLETNLINILRERIYDSKPYEIIGGSNHRTKFFVHCNLVKPESWRFILKFQTLDFYFRKQFITYADVHRKLLVQKLKSSSDQLTQKNDEAFVEDVVEAQAIVDEYKKASKAKMVRKNFEKFGKKLPKTVFRP